MRYATIGQSVEIARIDGLGIARDDVLKRRAIKQFRDLHHAAPCPSAVSAMCSAASEAA